MHKCRLLHIRSRLGECQTSLQQLIRHRILFIYQWTLLDKKEHDCSKYICVCFSVTTELCDVI